MSDEEMISLECPCCQGELYQPLTWFKQAEFSCPACKKSLTSGEFLPTINALEEAMEAFHEEMVSGGKPAACCCAGKRDCSGGND